MKTDWLHRLGALTLLAGAAGLAWHGQPTPSQKWASLAAELGPLLHERQIHIEPAEMLALLHNDYIDLALIDLRHERDWNLFHLWGAERIEPEQLIDHMKRFSMLPENGVIVFVSNDETLATQAWKETMAAASQPNAYILAGGINRWLDEFIANKAHQPRDNGNATLADGTLRHDFEWALGSRHPASLPRLPHADAPAYAAKVKLLKRVVKKGGCG